MAVDGSFRTVYRDLEDRMKARAEQDGDVCLPNCEPGGKVNYVLICMEPSLGRWAGRGEPHQRAERARIRINDGFRNFLPSDEVAILHFCIRRYLCSRGERYHITDVSKGAMLVKKAGRERERRYAQWFQLLQEEIDLMAAPNAGIVAVGSEVTRCLKRLGFRWPFSRIIHYSGLARRARRAGIVGHEAAFAAFQKSVSHKDLVATAQEAMKSMNVPVKIQEETISRLNKFTLTISAKQLMFNYKLAFESQKAGRERPGSASLA